MRATHSPLSSTLQGSKRNRKRRACLKPRAAALLRATFFPLEEREGRKGSLLLAEGTMSDPPGPLTETEYALRRRLPRRLPRRHSDIYVNMKTDFKAQLSRCQKLLAPGTGCPEICIHGLGLAINRAINIALQLEATGGGSFRLAANTSTVELVDVAEPEGDSDEPVARTRNNSAIHIRVCRIAPE